MVEIHVCCLTKKWCLAYPVSIINLHCWQHFLGGGINPLMPQYPQTNSPNWSLYISLRNELGEIDKRSEIFLFVIIWLILIDVALDNLWILLGENWCWSLLGLKGLTKYCTRRLCLEVQPVSFYIHVPILTESIPFIDKWYPFHFPSFRMLHPFNCFKRTFY